MHKRILCVLLAMLIMLSLIPAFALTSQAASNMKTGEKCIQILKDMEGFVKYPMWDHSHYSVGYGSTCGKDDYPNGITEAEADALLRKFLSTMEAELNRFADRHDIIFSQNQFDALMLFTYNCGTGWLYGDGDFRQAVLDDATGNDFIYYFSQWSAAGGELHLGLVNRRLIEADMYLNGSYTNVKPDSFTYVLFDNNGGEGSARVQGYDSNLDAYVMSSPTRNGHKFLGWYTQAEGGSWITELSAQNGKQTLYAHWQGADISVRNPAPVSYQRSSALLVSREIYDIPNGSVTGSLSEDTAAEIRGEYVDDNGVKWGRLPNGSWVKLGDPRIGAGNETEPKDGIKVKVTGDCVNVRTGPGTGYKVVAMVLEGDQVVLTQVQDVDGVLWGRFRAGWICLQYTDYTGGLTPDQPDESDPGETETTAPQEPETTVPETTVPETTVPETTVPETTAPEATEPETTVPETTESEEEEVPVVQGIPARVTCQTTLNIRADAGTNFARVGAYSAGQKIAILEQKSVGNVMWGRTDKGWVSMQYVRLEDSWKNESGVYAVVNCTGSLNIRSGPGVAYRPVGGYPAGTRIVVLEQTVVSGQKWGRTNKGWVSMDFVRLEASVPGDEQKPDAAEPETNVPEVTQPQEKPNTVTGTVTANYLNVRNAAGTTGKIVGGYSRGSKVTILEQTMVNGTAWGRTNKGWISLAYVNLDMAGTNGSANEGVITATVLCIRKGAGTGNAMVGTYTKGQKVTILETTKVGLTTWGRTDKGWICMDYVK